MTKYLITDTKHLRFHREGYVIDEAHLLLKDGYSTVSDLEILGMKPIGRIYFGQLKNLNYTTGEPVEAAMIGGGEKGVVDNYLVAGRKVYTEEQVIDLINSRIYEKNDKMRPKLPEDVYKLLYELSSNEAMDKPSRAKSLMEKYGAIDYEENAE